MNIFACLILVMHMISCEKDPRFEQVSYIKTTDATGITVNSAVLNGEFQMSYGDRQQVNYAGFCISTSPSFTPEDTKVYELYIYNFSTTFTQEVKDLKENTTYFYYAYVRKWDKDAVLKGEAKSFITKPFIVPTGAIKGLFAISSAKQVFFSKGNLQYRASTNTWRFAEHQYDYIGDANSSAGATYSGWIDLFGWGTSGYNNKYPYMTSTTYTDYIQWNSISGTNYDWGVYNAISNGGNKAGQWRTLTDDEWNYLRRSGCSDKTRATVCGIHGYILLPLNFVKPSEIDWVSQASNWSINIYNAQSWEKLEAAGAVFLPAAGYRSGTSVYALGTDGEYWSSTRHSGEGPQFQKFSESIAISNYYYYLSSGYYGGSVRLVQDYE